MRATFRPKFFLCPTRWPQRDRQSRPFGNTPQWVSPFNMLKTTLLHPDILRVVARAGHHAKILIADGNYPASTKRGPNAELVCLQLTPGVPTVAQVLRALISALPVDQVNTMGIPADDPYAQQGDPP